MPPCPHCGGHIRSNADTLRQRRHANGQCVDCAGPLTDKEKTKGHWRCFECRKRNATLNKRRRAKLRVLKQVA